MFRTEKPPAAAIYRRDLCLQEPILNTLPFSTKVVRHNCIAFPLIAGDKSPPQMEISAFSLNAITGPDKVTSSAAAFSLFPTNIFTIRCARWYIAPIVIYLYFLYPYLHKSITVVSTHDFSIVSMRRIPFHVSLICYWFKADLVTCF